MTPIYRDFLEFLRLLNVNKVKYLLVGGYAVGLHGYIRSTGDMDVWVHNTRANWKRILSVLTEFGFGDCAPGLDVAMGTDNILRMGVAPFRIELLNTIDGVDFEKCYKNRVEMDLDGTLVVTIGLSDLKKNKKASGRHKDLDDLEHL